MNLMRHEKVKYPLTKATSRSMLSTEVNNMKHIKTMKLNAHEAITLEHHGYRLILKDFGKMIWEVWQKEEQHEEEKESTRDNT